MEPRWSGGPAGDDNACVHKANCHTNVMYGVTYNLAPHNGNVLLHLAYLVTGGRGEGLLAVFAPDGPQLGAQGSQVGVLHLLGLPVFGFTGCHSGRQVVLFF